MYKYVTGDGSDEDREVTVTSYNTRYATLLGETVNPKLTEKLIRMGYDGPVTDFGSSKLSDVQDWLKKSKGQDTIETVWDIMMFLDLFEE